MTDRANRLQGQIAVVTGGSRGIGRATALRLARAGAQVTVGDYRIDPANEADFGPLQIRQEVCDVRDLAQLRSLIDGAAARGGRLDILVNNAGIVMVKPVTDVSEDDWDRCLDTNLKAAFFGTKYAIPHMRAVGGGSIVNMASNAGLLPRSHDPVYSISKMALVGLTKGLALSHSPDRIRVNCVCPGPVEATGIMDEELALQPDREAAVHNYIAASPLARAWDRMIHPDEIAEAICYLVSDAARMVTGTSLAIDGGKSLGVPPR
ncbi:MAG: SDR family oxidoreductase [Planctomycetota bacterium]|nr:MAG: SDR family oxidoreductase [Planctomycetota bacterium]